ncbi:MAG: hypothetical protein LBJ19_02430, partial [Holosporaceae bacterium]|nr:hypothetical protein [Holosporaceae bacterium]
MNSWLRANKVEVTILVTMAMVLNVFIHIQTSGTEITFRDTDDYMQLMRIRDFFCHHDWSNNVISKCNVPFGGELHWTRFYDIFLIVPSYVLSFFTSSINDAIEYVGFCISPVVQAFTVVFFLHLSQFLMSKRSAFVCTTIFASHPLILPYEVFGRPDHHAFMIMLFLIFLSNIKDMASIFTCDKRNSSAVCWRRHALKMAFITMLGVWLSPELLVLFLMADGLVFLWWLFGSKNYNSHNNSHILCYLCLKNTATSVLICTVIFSGISTKIVVLLALLILFYVIFRFCCCYENCQFSRNNSAQGQIPSVPETIAALMVLLMVALCVRSNAIEYDRISFVHFVLYLYSAIFMWICGNYCFGDSLKSKLITCFCYFALLFMLFLALYEKFLLGLAADVSDYLKKIWMYRVLEMQSPFELGYGKLFVINCVMELIAIGLKITDLVKIWETTDRTEIFPAHAVVWSII